MHIHWKNMKNKGKYEEENSLTFLNPHIMDMSFSLLVIILVLCVFNETIT